MLPTFNFRIYSQSKLITFQSKVMSFEVLIPRNLLRFGMEVMKMLWIVAIDQIHLTSLYCVGVAPPRVELMLLGID